MKKIIYITLFLGILRLVLLLAPLFFIPALIIVIILTICSFFADKIKNAAIARAEAAFYQKLLENRSNKPDEEQLKKLFSVSSKDILIAEKIISPDGKKLKKPSSIKDAVKRAGAQDMGNLTFSIDKNTGVVYKILEMRETKQKHYYIIEFGELNSYLEMNAEAWDKYKVINKENWKTKI